MLYLIHIIEFKLPTEMLDQAKANAVDSRGSFEVFDDFDAGMQGADVVYAKSWGCMLTTEDHDESARISQSYTDFKLTR